MAEHTTVYATQHTTATKMTDPIGILQSIHVRKEMSILLTGDEILLLLFVTMLSMLF